MKTNISNVTLNGKPLTAEDIAKITRRKIRNRAFTNGLSPARSSQGHVIYEAGQKAQKIRVCEEVFAWKDKAPYIQSGYSILGAVELTIDENEAKCAECGHWFECVSGHLKSHKITGKAYRIKHGLLMRSSLNSTKHTERKRKQTTQLVPATSSRPILNKANTEQAHEAKNEIMAARRTITGRVFSEIDNLRLNCEAQRISALKEFAQQLGRAPSQGELKGYTDSEGKHPLNPSNLRRFFRTPVRAIFLRAGLMPRRAGIDWKMPVPHKHHRTESLVNGHLPR